MESARREQAQQEEDSTPSLGTPSQSWVEVASSSPSTENDNESDVFDLSHLFREASSQTREASTKSSDNSSSESSSETPDSSSDDSSVESMTDEAVASVEIGGVKIKLAATARKDQVEDAPMFKKEERSKLTEDKRNDLYEKATKNVLTKFDLMSLSIKDEDKLDDTYNMHILIAKMKAHLIKYDMHDVFQVLDVKEDGKSVGLTTKNLFLNYATITEE
jgi:hypothetical protein